MGREEGGRWEGEIQEEVGWGDTVVENMYMNFFVLYSLYSDSTEAG